MGILWQDYPDNNSRKDFINSAFSVERQSTRCSTFIAYFLVRKVAPTTPQAGILLFAVRAAIGKSLLDLLKLKANISVRMVPGLFIIGRMI